MNGQELLLCDRCSSIVNLTGYRAEHKDGRELLLCPVHFRDHDVALAKQGWTVDRITPPEPEAGAPRRVACSVCTGSAAARVVKASPESVPVAIVHCVSCDRRRCNARVGLGKCEAQPINPADPICSKGHPLIGDST